MLLKSFNSRPTVTERLNPDVELNTSFARRFPCWYSNADLSLPPPNFRRTDTTLEYAGWRSSAEPWKSDLILKQVPLFAVVLRYSKRQRPTVPNADWNLAAGVVARKRRSLCRSLAP